MRNSGFRARLAALALIVSAAGNVSIGSQAIPYQAIAGFNRRSSNL
jgi:hypothetical protein